MGSVFDRGSTSESNWYIKYRDIDGKWHMMPSGKPTKAQARQMLVQIEARIAQGKAGIEQPVASPRCEPLMKEWAAALSNRNATDDRQRLEKHVRPVFGSMALKDVTLPVVMRWLDAMRAKGGLSAGSMRHNLNLLGRFFSWAIERGHATVNPVRQIPTGKRPQEAQRRDVPWLDDDAMVRQIFHALPEPFGLMFYLGNRSGVRLGEIVGLRLSDLDFLAKGTLRVRFSHDGPRAPASADMAVLFGPWLAQRRAAGAGPEDLLFPCPTRGGRCYRKELIEARWEAVAEKLELSTTFYQATRHSFVSRTLSHGASLDEVSAAVGHSSPIVTRRYYDHFVRRDFSATLREGLGLGGDNSADIIPLYRKASG